MDNLYKGTEIQKKLMTGVRKIAEAVGATMGTSGQNSLIECIERPGHYSTNDGYSIVNSIRLSEPLEELGRNILMEAISKANKASGDGSSTTCVLTSAILESGIKHLKETSPMELKRSLENCIPLIEKSINSQKKEINVDNVAPVASISAEDEEIGKRIQEIYQQIGKDGIIQWDISKTPNDSYTLGTGITMNGATYVSPFMCDIDESGMLSSFVRWDNPLVLLAKQKITSAADFNDLFQTLYNKERRELVIFCEDIEIPVIADLVRTRAIRGFKSVVVKMPILWRDEWWEDLALASGGTIISPESGISLKNTKENNLGEFKNITITRENVYIDGIKDITKHLEMLSIEDTDKSKLRIARLNTKTARYFVGAHSESALAYKRLKVEDALNAAALALESGVVAGGGVCLINSARSLPNTVGGRILKEALLEPYKRILYNCGLKPKFYYDNETGFDTRTKQKVSMFKENIIDPAEVVLNAVRNAIGVAASILTTGTVVLLPMENGQEKTIPLINK